MREYGLSKVGLSKELSRSQIKSTGHAQQRVDRNHALAAFDLPDVGEAQLRLEREFLLRELACPTLRPNHVTDLTLKLRGGIWHIR